MVNTRVQFDRGIHSQLAFEVVREHAKQTNPKSIVKIECKRGRSRHTAVFFVEFSVTERMNSATNTLTYIVARVN